MSLKQLNPKNNIDLSILTDEPAIASGDYVGFDDVSATVPKQRRTTWGNLLTKIQEYLVTAFVQPGDVKASFATSLTGWVLASGLTIGSVASSATGRANADTLALYTLLWDNTSNTYFPIEDSAGSPTTRGASAAADFSANKRLPLPDLRGRVPAGRDNMGGTSANRLTNGGSTIVGSALGSTGGAENVTLTEAQLAAHTHDVDVPATTAASAATGTDVAIPGATAPVTSTSTGDGDAHLNVQPTIVVNYFIKL